MQWICPGLDTTHFPPECRAHFNLIWPTVPRPQVPRVCMLVKKNIQWHLVYYAKDVVSIYVKADDHHAGICIHNVYNEPGTPENTGIRALQEAREAAKAYHCGSEDTSEVPEHIIVGDINIHDPLWSGDGPISQAAHNEERAERFKALIEEAPWAIITPPGTKTRPARPGDQGPGSTIDLCLTSWELQNQVRHCRIARGLSGISDHEPVETEININLTPRTFPQRRNWKLADEKKFLETLEAHLPESVEASAGEEELDQQTMKIVQALNKAAEAAIPWLRITKHSAPGFNGECRQLQAEAKRLRRGITNYQAKHRRPAPEEMVAEYKHALQVSKRAVKKLRREAHRKRVTDASQSMQQVWGLAKWTKDRTTKYIAYTPPLVGRDSSIVYPPEQKAELMAETFFPPAPEADLSDTIGYKYPEPLVIPDITTEEVRQAIEKTKEGKAPGPDTIPNQALHMGKDLISPRLSELFNACLRRSYCPRHFREAITISLRKPGRGDYSIPKAYRPIALLNTVGKIMEAVIATRLSYITEAFQLLPEAHHGGRKGRGAETALHSMLEQIYSAWKENKTATLLLLDVSGAFDNVSHERLLHNLRKRRVPIECINWLASFLSDRYTSLVMPDFTKERFHIDTGIPQGSPLSPILYIYYNADLLEEDGLTSDSAFIDDISVLAVSDSEDENIRKLEESHASKIPWAETHSGVFGIDKYQLMHLPPPLPRQRQALTNIPDLNPIEEAAGGSEPERSAGKSLLLRGGAEVEAREQVKLLGVILDPKLTFDAHLGHVKKKTTARLQAVSALGGGKWGLSLKQLRLVYNACIAPIALYAAPVWYQPRVRGNAAAHDRQVRGLSAVQRRACKAISGGFRLVSGDAYNAELHLLPMSQRIQRLRLQSLARIATTPAYAEILNQRVYHRNPLLQTPLQRAEEELQLIMNMDMDRLEMRHPFGAPPWWEAPQISIEGSAFAAVTVHNINEISRPATRRIYTDGSGINGSIGCAAVSLEPPYCEKVYMGTEAESSVALAELAGIALALRLANTVDEYYGYDIEIYTDNQSALKTLRSPRQASGQYLVRQIVGALDSWQVKYPGRSVQLHWIPAHVGVPGNEAADYAAKEATGWSEHGPGHGERAPTLDHLGPTVTRSAVERWIRGRTRDGWAQEWEKSSHGAALRQWLPRLDRKSLQLYDSLTKAESTVLVQLRTGKIGFQAYLAAIGVSDSALCHCGRSPQTIKHILMECQEYDALGIRTWTGEGAGIPRTLNAFLTDPKRVKKTTQFVLNTGLIPYLANEGGAVAAASSSSTPGGTVQ